MTSVDLQLNSIGRGDGAKAIAEALKVNAVVTTLYLGDNSIGDEGAIVIAEALKVNAVLTELHLWEYNIGYDGAKVIAEALKVNAMLKFFPNASEEDTVKASHIRRPRPLNHGAEGVLRAAAKPGLAIES